MTDPTSVWLHGRLSGALTPTWFGSGRRTSRSNPLMTAVPPS